MFGPNVFITGGAFEEKTELQGLLSKRMNILYGRNGSGKSSIARAFRELQQNNNEPKKFKLSFDKNQDSIPSEILDRIFVFNEDFINDNIRIKGNVKSIVMVGESAQHNDQIQKYNSEIDDWERQRDAVRQEIKTLDGSKNISGSIKKVEEDLKFELKKDGGFISRLNRITGKTNNLTSTLIDKIKNLSPDKLEQSLGASTELLNKRIDQYNNLKGGNEVFWTMPILLNYVDIDLIKSLFAEIVRPVSLSEEEKALLEDLSNALSDESFLEKTQSIIIDGHRNICPLCHQPLSDDYRFNLEKKLKRFRDKSVEDFKLRIQHAISTIREIDIDSTFQIAPSSEYQEDLDKAKNAINKFNDNLKAIVKLLDNKLKNPFSTFSFDEQEFNTALNESIEALKNLDSSINVYNQNIKENDKKRSEIEQDNITLAYFENEQIIQKITDKKLQFDKLEKEESDLSQKIHGNEEAIQKLQSQTNQIDDARESINNYLKLIFGYEKIKLMPNNKDSYKLQVKGKNSTYSDIAPESVSSGERNAIAMAYFYACILENRDKQYSFKDPTLLIIDDPISSFDSDNKAGVISLVSSLCKKVIEGNPAENKVLVLTHDLGTLRDLCNQRVNFIDTQYCYELRNNMKDTYLTLKQNHILKNNSLVKYIADNLDYGNELFAIYSFAKSPDPDDFEGIDTIGNTIRKFAESYARHTYKCAWFHLFSDTERLECIPPDRREHFKSFAIRNVLNSESHGNFDSYSAEELQRSARIVLVYIFWADKGHLKAYLQSVQNNPAPIDTIESWINLI